MLVEGFVIVELVSTLLAGQYFNTITHYKLHFPKEWEVFSGTCYQNGDCPSTSLKCIEDEAEKAFVVQITFKQMLDPVSN